MDILRPIKQEVKSEKIYLCIKHITYKYNRKNYISLLITIYMVYCRNIPQLNVAKNMPLGFGQTRLYKNIYNINRQ